MYIVFYRCSSGNFLLINPCILLKTIDYVFVGVDRETLWKCQQVAAANVNHNLLLIATDEQIRDAGFTEHDFEKCRCGIHPGPVAELDLCHKICMLQDERVVAFDQLTIV